MASQIRAFLQRCGTCKEIKAPFVPVQPELGQARTSNSPWRMISVDYIGPLPRSKHGYQHLLVVLDVYSKYVMLVPVRKISSASLCTILREQWFHRHGCPEVLLSDNAATFTSKEFGQFLKEQKVNHWLNAKYHSQANPVERVNRSINAAIRAYARSDQRNWDLHVSDVERVLNITTHSSTGFSPYFIVHGCEMASAEDFSGNSGEMEDDLQERHRRIKKIREIVDKNLRKASESVRHQYNLRHRKFAKPFEVGQMVYRRNTKQSDAVAGYNAKLGPQYLPAKVLRRRGASSYELADLDGKNIGFWPANLLKPA